MPTHVAHALPRYVGAVRQGGVLTLSQGRQRFCRIANEFRPEGPNPTVHAKSSQRIDRGMGLSGRAQLSIPRENLTPCFRVRLSFHLTVLQRFGGYGRLHQLAKQALSIRWGRSIPRDCELWSVLQAMSSIA